ncbi:MAG: hypothetical protein QXS79_02580 [Candidatus Bathyarchaeia archaeon]
MSANENGRIIKVASSEGVSIYCPREGKFSLFNSPYPAHKAYTAIDIYPNRDFGLTALSPVLGEIKEIREVACPEKNSFKSTRTTYDYVILMHSLENPKYWVKILHLEPLVKVGDIVRVGEEMGILLRSGFFDYWTDPHIHIEVRNPSDPIRARGGLKLKREIVNLNEDNNVRVEELRGVIVELKPEYALMLLDGDLKYGIPVEVCGKRGLIDGGVPHYGFFGVHIEHENKTLQSGPVKLCGAEIGIIEHTYSDAYLIRCLNQTFKVKNAPVKLSFYLYLSKPLVKIILEKPGKPKLEKFEEISVTISS